jgi:hypothetical protein
MTDANIKWLDADTYVTSDGVRHRLPYVDAPEVTKSVTDKSGRKRLVLGSDDGETAAVQALQKQGQFNTNKDMGGSSYGRPISDLISPTGASLTETAVIEGIIQPTPDTAKSIPASLLAERELKAATLKVLGVNPASPVEEAPTRIAAKLKETQKAAGVRYAPMALAQEEATFAALREMTGRDAQFTALEEIERIQDLLDGKSVFGPPSPEARLKLEQELNDNVQKMIFASTHSDPLVGGVVNRSSDRTLRNKAKSPISESFDSGLSDLMNAPFALAEGIGNTLDWHGLKTWAQSHTWDHAYRQGRRPSVVGFGDVRKEWKDDEFGFRDIDITVEALVNTLAGSAPQMLLMMVPGGTALNAAAYTGMFYQKQEDDKKNLALALPLGVGAAVLDKIGLEAMVGSKFLNNAADRAAVVQALRDRNPNLTERAAEQLLATESKKSLLELAQWSQDMATRQINTWGQATAKVAVAGAAESVTETMQTALEIMSQGRMLTPDDVFDKKVTDQMLDAAMGGLALGGAIKAGVNRVDSMAWASLRDGVNRATVDLVEGQQLQQELRTQALAEGRRSEGAASVDRQLALASNEALTLPIPANQDTFASLETAPGGVVNAMKRALMDPVSLLRSLADTTIPSIRDANGQFQRHKAIIKSILKPGILSGDHFDGFRQRVVAEQNMPSKATTATTLGVNEKDVDGLLHEAWRKGWSQEGQLLAPGSVMHQGRDMSQLLNQWWGNMHIVSTNLANFLDRNNLSPDEHSVSPRDVFETMAVSPSKVRQNRTRLIQNILNRDSSMMQTTASGLIDNLISGNPEKTKQAYQTLTDLGVPQDPTLRDIFETPLYEQLENHKQQVATLAAVDKYLGRNGEKLANLILLADKYNEWASPQERAAAVKNLSDWQKIIHGNYHDLQDMPALQTTMAWANTLTMMAFLPKAAVSSIPEFALSAIGTDGKGKIMAQFNKAVKEGLKNYGDHIQSAVSWANSFLGLSFLTRSNPDGRLRNEADRLWNDLSRATTQAERERITNKVHALYEKNLGHSLFTKLGYDDSGYNVQARWELSDLKARKGMALFSKMIGLEAQTNAFRTAQLHMAADILQTHLNNLLHAKQNGVDPAADPGSLNSFEAESHRLLTLYGGDVGRMIQLMEEFNATSDQDFSMIMQAFASDDANVFTGSPNEVALRAHWSRLRTDLQDTLHTVLRNMVDSKMANPQSSNMPKFIHDPRLRIFTIMTRFMTALTSTVLPFLYKNYIINGTKHMRLQGFTTIMMALALGHLTSPLKDMISYGDDENPYLKSFTKQTQRAIYNSGLLGQTQGLIDRVMPLYDFKKPVNPDASLPERLAIAAKDQVLQSAPTLSWGANLLGGVRRLATSEGEPDEVIRGAKDVMRSTPILGGLPGSRELLGEVLKQSLQDNN